MSRVCIRTRSSRALVATVACFTLLYCSHLQERNASRAVSEGLGSRVCCSFDIESTFAIAFELVASLLLHCRLSRSR
jgi:hypothetical protein